MYVASGLLFLHVPRSAGTFVTNVLERVPGTRNVNGTSPFDGVRKLGEISSNRLTFGCIRDPWSWYVSLYCSYKNKSGGLTGPLSDVCGNGASFAKALVAMTKPEGQALLTAPKYPGHPTGLPQLGRTLRSTGIGLWSWYVATTYCVEPVEEDPGFNRRLDDGGDLPWSADVLVDSASVGEGLSQVLSAWGGPKAAETKAFLERAPPINEAPPQYSWKGVRPSGRPDPRWWDEESTRAVLEVDGPLLRRFGFDAPPGGRPVCHLLQRSPG